MKKVVTIELPPDVLESAGISKSAARLEIALAFYRAESLSLEMAAALAGLSVPLFMDAVAGHPVGLLRGPQRLADDSKGFRPLENYQLKTDAPVVVGVDVGGLGKGFHAVALANGCFEPRHFRAANEVHEWIMEVQATVVAIDAPCKWAVSGKSRLAERELAIDGKTIQCFKTPSRTVAAGNPFYGWVYNGETLYELLRNSHELFDGSQQSGKIVLETFPHAVACALAGSVIPASPKGVNRRRSLIEQGFDVRSLSNIDFVDAALCALTALHFHLGLTMAFGDANEGFIVVPRCTTKQLLLQI